MTVNPFVDYLTIDAQQIQLENAKFFDVVKSTICRQLDKKTKR